MQGGLLVSVARHLMGGATGTLNFSFLYFLLLPSIYNLLVNIRPLARLSSCFLFQPAFSMLRKEELAAAADGGLSWEQHSTRLICSICISLGDSTSSIYGGFPFNRMIILILLYQIISLIVINFFLDFIIDVNIRMLGGESGMVYLLLVHILRIELLSSNLRL